ncbi:MAG: tRNA (N6-isopentenyl adenosine(37)-C2)-methylthiotransferase MiaB [Candidatus Paraimprobicoccus trichonymphae]|uniref:tRNA-2-methylthio-N(6)-dimethylallyladenosine synthase n=1 Tax=Candidatus Paraimprobicoccus trichonymphae TaxID=3033793 RepID=A0AA48KXH0_9FIRM|nr:MAG: tRNA (N6-isopentenyl adenosine(37)-C2)-methylthiotransferase MiaB [Candidatus Paraimprobicoccus trichonymphae]
MYKVFVRTFGCQQNVSDSEKIKGMLEKLGFKFVSAEKEADLIIFNTCAVREHAQNRILGNIGILKKLKKEKPNLKIIICGCMSEQNYIKDQIKQSCVFVDLVLGVNYFKILPKILCNMFNLNNLNEDFCKHIVTRRDDNTKAWVSITNGCDNFCSYCIVPYVRGREKSKNSEDIVAEVEGLIKKGYKEITLLGQNVNSYGKNLLNKIDFSDLLVKLDNLKGEFNLNFMTSHPKDATKKLINTIADSKHISRTLHLPFQSGNNEILFKMNRNYTRESYLEIVNYAKIKIKNLKLTSDVIVGFPGETYEKFLDTLSLVRKVKFKKLFTFIFSPRKGTKAFEFEDKITYEEKSKWFSELLRVQSEIRNL